MFKTIGVLAHVDAGKTTFSEQILFHAHAIRSRGRVDHQDAFLDSHPIERERGITVFSDQAAFAYGDSEYCWVDTPGHADFTAEMERAIRVMDYAVVIVSCVEGVQGHTETVWRLLEAYGVPVFFFLNKTDRTGADPQDVLAELQAKFSSGVCDFSDGFSHGQMTEAFAEQIAEQDDALLERYLTEGFGQASWLQALRGLIKSRKVFPCFCGSALQDEGIEGFLQDLDLLTETDYDDGELFSALVYKVRHDARGGRITFIKVMSGKLRVKEAVGAEKAHEIRIYNGAKYTSVQQAQAGQLCAVTGLSSVAPGEGIGMPGEGAPLVSPMLTAKVLFSPSVPAKTMLGYFRILEAEDPMLRVAWVEALSELRVHIMGTVQLEILSELVKSRFGQEVSFGESEVLYQETIADTVVGYGHYEPLRHYAEVHLRLSPNERGRGITFASECSADALDQNWQNLIRTHVFEREHKGLLTGSVLTDVQVTLLAGRAHLKHTEGGDFREATCRAIRQGLEQAQNVLLEPYYAFTARVSTEQAGRVLADVQRMSGSFSPPETGQSGMIIRGRAPVSEMMRYPAEVAAFTHGKGSISLSFDGYEPCHNAKEVIERIGYDKDRDVENPSGSVFCAHGAGFYVRWDEAEGHMHCK